MRTHIWTPYMIDHIWKPADHIWLLICGYTVYERPYKVALPYMSNHIWRDKPYMVRHI